MPATPTPPTKPDDEFSKRLADAMKGVSETKTDHDTDDQTDQRPDGEPVGDGDHVVRDGECVSSIARDTGHFWQRIWDDPANAEVKEVRKQPNVLMAGDKLTIPELRQKYESGESEMRHRFVRRGEPSHLAIRILDEDVPRANEPFTLVIDGDQTIEGTTDPEGKIDVPIPGNAKRGKLTVGEEPDVLEYDLNLGNLDPVETWKGVQSRLKNMGIDCEITGKKDEQTMEAVNEFRHQQGQPSIEDLDDDTRQQIQEEHGS